MKTYEFKLPDIGEGVTEGEIVKWLVSPGDSVKEDQTRVVQPWPVCPTRSWPRS